MAQKKEPIQSPAGAERQSNSKTETMRRKFANMLGGDPTSIDMRMRDPQMMVDSAAGMAGGGMVGPVAGTMRGLGGDALEGGSLYGLDRARAAANQALEALGQRPGAANDVGGLGLLKLIEAIMTDPNSARKLFGQ